MTGTDILLSIRGLTKAYPGVVANDDVSFDIGRGEVHALLGENGAGKSTLVKMIYGLVKPDSGEMVLNGAAFAPSEPQAARAAGVAMVFQHFSLFDALNVAENIALGMADPPAMRDLATRIRDVSEQYGLPLDPYRTVGDLSAGERQRVEIVRCLLQDPKLLIMDEPTSVLTPQEVEILFATLRKLSAEGTAILYISHKLEEIRALCDAATILRLGRKVAECTPRETTAREMAELMVGSELLVPERTGKARAFAKAIIERFDVRTPGTENAARSLSGGNLQKFVIGREVMQRPDVLVVNQPTWGVDAAAAAVIRQALLDLAEGGTAVIVISQDLDELMEVSDRFAALNEGRLSEVVPAQGLTVEQIGLMMGGAHGMEVAHV